MRTNSRGFTLIELMLAMTFISILMIAIAVSTIEVMHMYSKGLAIKSVNQAGRDLGDSIRRDAASVGVVKSPIIQPDDAGAGGLGRLCLGGVSYLWNKPEALQQGSTTGVTYSDNTAKKIVLARVIDAGGNYCTKTGETYPINVSSQTANEMLPSDNGDLALHSLTLDRVPPLTEVAVPSEALYDIRYTIGTNDAGTINTGDLSCNPPADANQNYNFCSINNFEMIVRVG